MNSFIGKFARKTGLYGALRYSWIYAVIQRFRNPEHLRKLNEEEAFYRMLVGRNAELIFDVGANVGDKAEVFSRIARRVICFEPDPRLAEHLRCRFRGCSRVVVEQCGVSDRDGSAELHAYDGGSAYNTFNKRQHELVAGDHHQHELFQVPLVTLDEMISRYGRPDFIKIDVEGHEREVLAGLSKTVPLLSYEANLPSFSEETCEVARRVVEIMGEEVAFAVGGSGYQMTGEYPLGIDSLCALIMKPDAPSYLEVFARRPVLDESV
jgi:FkbM family methyltransferase